MLMNGIQIKFVTKTSYRNLFFWGTEKYPKYLPLVPFNEDFHGTRDWLKYLFVWILYRFDC